MSNKYHFCPRCGQQLLTNANFCHNCGTNLKFTDLEINEKEELSQEIETSEDTIMPFVEEISDTTEIVEEKLAKEIDDEFEDEEEDNPLISKIFMILISIIVVILFVIGIIFAFKVLNIKINIPFLNNNKTQEVVVENPKVETVPTPTEVTGELNDVIESYVKNNQGDYSKITSLVISGTSIKINDSSPSSNAQKAGNYNLDALAKLTKLENLEIANVADLKFPTTSFSNVKNLIIKNSNIDSNLSGLSNITSLESLTIINSNISSLNGISSALNLKKLILDANGLNDISPLSGLKLNEVKITNNSIKDYRPLANSNVSLPSSTTRDENARQIKVLIDDLNARKTPDASLKDNIIPNGVTKDTYYYILDEKQDSSLGLTWYRIDADKWIAGKEGEWTKLYE